MSLPHGVPADDLPSRSAAPEARAPGIPPASPAPPQARAAVALVPLLVGFLGLVAASVEIVAVTHGHAAPLVVLGWIVVIGLVLSRLGLVWLHRLKAVQRPPGSPG